MLERIGKYHQREMKHVPVQFRELPVVLSHEELASDHLDRSLEVLKDLRRLLAVEYAIVDLQRNHALQVGAPSCDRVTTSHQP
jgi:hypothetical protein